MAKEWERIFFAEHILPAIGRSAANLPYHQVTGFLSMTGDLYDGALMVVGRAVNGWTEGKHPADLSTPPTAAAYAENVFDSVTRNGGCPMQWVAEYSGEGVGDDNTRRYNTNKSAFWRVTKRVVGDLGIADTDTNAWPSHLVWSNLYKVAPADGRNPGETLGSVQLPSCILLLQSEISAYRPRRLLFLTGFDWAKPFLDQIAPAIARTETYQYVEAVGDIGDGDGRTRVVVAAHPQGKPEAYLVEEVLTAFNA